MRPGSYSSWTQLQPSHDLVSFYTPRESLDQKQLWKLWEHFSAARTGSWGSPPPSGRLCYPPVEGPTP